MSTVGGVDDEYLDDEYLDEGDYTITQTNNNTYITVKPSRTPAVWKEFVECAERHPKPDIILMYVQNVSNPDCVHCNTKWFGTDVRPLFYTISLQIPLAERDKDPSEVFTEVRFRSAVDSVLPFWHGNDHKYANYTIADAVEQFFEALVADICRYVGYSPMIKGCKLA